MRGAEIAMVFQDPMSSLDPVYRIGDQIVEQIRAHDPKMSKDEALERAVELIDARRASRTPSERCARSRTSSRAACASA